MGTIRIQNLELHGNHGAYKAEKQIKQRFLINIQLDLNIEQAALEDDLHRTVNYEEIVRICRNVMAVPASLLETLARRIALGIKEAFPEIDRIEVTVSKPEVQLATKLYEVSVGYILN